ncbi:MAG: hypothetical protein ACREGH_00355, partial [Minisyncoccia bacterium]
MGWLGNIAATILLLFGSIFGVHSSPQASSTAQTSGSVQASTSSISIKTKNFSSSTIAKTHSAIEQNIPKTSNTDK